MKLLENEEQSNGSLSAKDLREAFEMMQSEDFFNAQREEFERTRAYIWMKIQE